MSTPTVCAVMLTRDRQEFAKRAVECFTQQTYENKALLIYDTGNEYLDVDVPSDVAHAKCPHSMQSLSIGMLRNNANMLVNADIVVHWDDDDWSHPNRIAEQVATLEWSGANVVGYNEMLFWRTCACIRHGLIDCGDCTDSCLSGEAWLYSNTVRSDYALDTSLCYWRKVWDSKAFPDLPLPDQMQSEGGRWLEGLKVQTVSGMGDVLIEPWHPRMIARIHGGNTMPYDVERISKEWGGWKRVPKWDEKVRFLMEPK